MWEIAENKLKKARCNKEGRIGRKDESGLINIIAPGRVYGSLVFVTARC